MTYDSVDSASFDRQVSRFGLWCAALCIVTAIIAALLPLDVPEGFSAAHAERLQWLTENRDPFVAAWVNQIVAMLSLSGLFWALCWRGRLNGPLSALLAAGAVAMATMAFVIPKFIAIWTIPLLANAEVTGGAGADMAAVLLPLLNVSIPFSLYTSFDYLGFWLYALFAVLMMKATVRQRLDLQTHCHLGGSIRNRFPRSVCLPSAGCHSGFRNRDQLWRLVHSVAATHIDSGSHFLA
jgi:hypothetical protein